MPEQSLNSLFGMLSTKELPTTSTPKNTNNSSQTNLNKKNFLTELANSIEGSSASYNQTPP
ncbi:MAG: hypothetical protein SCARUB_01213, partial [Candidatus Scalindua rubra]